MHILYPFILVSIVHCLSLGSSEDSSSPGSVSQSYKSPEPTVTSEADDPEMTSDPETSSDAEITSDSEMTSDAETTSDEDDSRSVVLEAALLHVPSLGWTPATLDEGARDVGLEVAAAGEMFPRYIIMPYPCVCEGKGVRGRGGRRGRGRGAGGREFCCLCV